MAKQSKTSASERRLRVSLAFALRGTAGCEDASHDSRDGDLAGEFAPIGMDRDPRATDGPIEPKANAIAVEASRCRKSRRRKPRRRPANCRRQRRGGNFSLLQPIEKSRNGIGIAQRGRPARWASGNSAKSRNPQMLSGGSPRPGDARGASCGERDPRWERKSRRGFGRLKFKCRDDLPLPSSCESLTRVCGAAAQRIDSRPSALAGASGAIP
jgi:hypothetical protein